LARPDDLVDCQNGAISIAGHLIHDHKPYGVLTVAQILAVSSDVGAIKIGLRLGVPKFYQYITAYGFGQPTGVDLPGEGHGILRHVENWSPISIGAVSMGQEIGVTPLQILTAMSAIANGGLIVQPHVISALRKGNESLAPPDLQPEPRRVIQATTAATMRQMLEGVLFKGGTGPLARLDGYTAGGKTGTAQKFDPATGRYSTSQYIASFVGFAPLNTPAISVIVQLDSPVGPHEGGEVAAPVFHRVAQQVLEYLNVPHDVPMDSKTKLELAESRRAPDDSLADGADFDPTSAATDASDSLDTANASDSSSGGASAPSIPTASSAPTASDARASATASAPPPAASRAAPAPAAAKNAAPQTVELDEEAGVQVPNLVGENVRDVTEQCEHLGLVPVLAGGGVALTQSPPAGLSVRRGTRVTVEFGRAAAATPSRVAAGGSPQSPPGGGR
jgi:cell division protein FtsI (penicillin-binding protein 3)